MTNLNIPLLQYVLFGRLKKEFQTPLEIVPTISPSANLVSNIYPNASNYIKFTSSCYKLIFDGGKFNVYLFFRNMKANDGSYTEPSSLEFLCPDEDESLLKMHYEQTLFPSDKEMKEYITSFINKVVYNFIFKCDEKYNLN